MTNRRGFMLPRDPTPFLTLIFLFFSVPSFSQTSLQRHDIFLELRGAYWVYAEDVDGDGDLDLVTAAFDGIDWWQNDGNQTFSKQIVDEQMQGAWSAHADDMDGDGDIDIMACSPSDDEVVLWLNDGNQNFDTRLVIDARGLDPETVITEDLDQDGDRDILVAYWESRDIVWYENSGDAQFTKHIIERDMKGAHSVSVADFDGDGDFDVVANGSSETSWYLNDGNQSFIKVPLSSAGGLVIYAVDLDQDGDADILRNQRNSGDVDWFENDGRGGFTQRTIATAFGDSWSIRAGDIDGDGDLDVAAAGFSANNITIWLNNGDTTFGAGIVIDNVTTPRFVHIADLDSDGDGDVAAAIRDDRDLAWYEVAGSPPADKSLTLTAPAPGDTLLAESTYEVAWQWTGAIEQVQIEFSADNGVSWNVLATVQNSGVYSWSVPNIFSPACLLRISGTAAGEPSDQNDAPFLILRQQDLPPSLTLLAPNGGEQVFVDSSFTLVWTATGSIPFVNIELSIDDGVSWSPIVGQTANDGAQPWLAPDTPSQFCRVRISDAANGAIFDVSDQAFAIERFVVPQSITVTAPAGGEALVADSTFTITWTSTGEIANVRLEFSADNGATWSDIAGSNPNTGSFLWRLPDTSSNLCMVRVSDAVDGDPAALNAGLFSIRRIAEFAPTITGFDPVSGPPGTLVTIQGSQLSSVTQVAFNGRPAAFSVLSDFQLQATVPAGATTGKITAMNFAGTGESAQVFDVRAGIETVVLSFPPADDAQVKATDPARNYGSKASFKVEMNTFRSYLKFPVTGLSGTILQARVRLRVTAGSDFGGTILRADNNFAATQTAWSEDSLTFNNAPALVGEPLDSLLAVAAGSAVEFNVTQAISGSGTYSFAITSRSTDQVEYDSKESAFSPELVVVIERQGNIPPFAENDVHVSLEDQVAVVPVAVNDLDADGEVDETSITIGAQPVHGAATANNDGTLTYLPEDNFFGEDSLTYTIRDNQGKTSNPATVRLTVTPVNDAPVAAPDQKVSLLVDSVKVNVVENDFDIDGALDPGSVQIVKGPNANAGIWLDTTSGTVIYLPDLSFVGVDSFTYTVRDDSGAVSNEAMVTIILQDGNQPPVAVNDTSATSPNTPLEINVVANDRDPEGHLDPVSVTIEAQPVDGQVSVADDSGMVLYTPNPDFAGTDSFTYTVKDALGLASAPAMVVIRVVRSNHPPAIQTFLPQETELTFEQGATIHFSIVATDPDADVLAFQWFVRNKITQQEVLASASAEYNMNTNEFAPATYTVRVDVSDGQAAVSQEWQLDLITSVELTSFAAHFSEFDGVLLTWTTGSEHKNAGFNVLRSQTESGHYLQINRELLPAVSEGSYQFADRNVVPGRRYFYKIEDVDVAGRKTLHGPVSVEVAAPQSFAVSQNYPNPFNPETRLRFQLPHSGRVSLTVYNVLGRAVRTLLDERKDAGFYLMTWDGRDDGGQLVGSGIYYYQILFGGSRYTGKMILMR
ncbi:MAG: tandem-95 repeat protein [bacterium]